MKNIFCIIGTDTEIGKTYSCCKLMEYLSSTNNVTSTLKPISSGVMHYDSEIINSDVYELMKFSNYQLTIRQINPFSFIEPIAPHIAAERSGIELTVKSIAKEIHSTLQNIQNVDYLFIEGVGGLMTPLNARETYLDLLKEINLPIILVVGIKLGCLNHTLLTLEALSANNLYISGWIANQIDNDMPCSQQNIDYLANKISAPLIATIQHKSKLQITKHFTEIILCY